MKYEIVEKLIAHCSGCCLPNKIIKYISIAKFIIRAYCSKKCVDKYCPDSKVVKL